MRPKEIGSGGVALLGVIVLAQGLVLSGCSEGQPAGEYELVRVFEVEGRQGITYFDGHLFITADDGDADEDEVDNLWRLPADAGGTAAYVVHEKAFEEFRRAGEIEGLAFDADARELLVLSNRGKRIVQGMPTGLYPGYDREIHEVYVYSLPDL